MLNQKPITWLMLLYLRTQYKKKLKLFYEPGNVLKLLKLLNNN